MQGITPHLWFDKEAKEAAEFYASIFEDSSVKRTTRLHDTPSGSVEIVVIELAGQQFTLLSAGPYFKFTPAISFLVSCDSQEEVDRLWDDLSDGGVPLMELGEYPFSQRYGWLQDRYGLFWQVMFVADGQMEEKLTPVLLFVGDVCGKAEEAIRFYTSVFENSSVGDIQRWGPDEDPEKEGTIKHARFTLNGRQFTAMESARAHDFAFNEAISFQVHCDTQEEIDYHWERLSANPKAEQCGWLKDRYGLSWQIVSTVMDKLFNDPDQEKIARLTQAFLKMKKLDIARLQEAFEGPE